MENPEKEIQQSSPTEPSSVELVQQDPQLPNNVVVLSQPESQDIPTADLSLKAPGEFSPQEIKYAQNELGIRGCMLTKLNALKKLGVQEHNLGEMDLNGGVLTYSRSELISDLSAIDRMMESTKKPAEQLAFLAAKAALYKELNAAVRVSLAVTNAKKHQRSTRQGNNSFKPGTVVQANQVQVVNNH